MGILIYGLILSLFAFLYYHLNYKRRNLPPGPIPLPIVGNLLSIIWDPPGEAPYIRWREKYGDVYTYWLSGVPVVSISGMETIKETFIKDGDAFAGRFTFDDFDILMRGGPYGVTFTEGDLWREQRRFLLHVLRDFGLGKNLMQERILGELECMLQKIEKDIEAGVAEHPLGTRIDLTIGSIINSLILGYRYTEENQHEFYDLLARVQENNVAVGDPLVMLAMPNPHFFKHIPIVKEHLQKAISSGCYLLDFFRIRIREHEHNFEDDAPVTDFVQAFLKEKRHREQNGELHYFSDDQLVSMCFDVWIAGQETTGSTLTWGFAYLIHNPRVQEKCFEELDRVIGMDRVITNADKNSLPYCNAVVYEMTRASNLLPQNLWHRTLKDVTVNGFNIPKGTAVVPQLSIVMYDKDLFPNPTAFIPERFIDENGKFNAAEGVIPFSIGKRVCPGEGLARMELFLFLTNILNKYRIKSGRQPPDLTRRYAGTVLIDPYSCVIERRKPSYSQ